MTDKVIYTRKVSSGSASEVSKRFKTVWRYGMVISKNPRDLTKLFLKKSYIRQRHRLRSAPPFLGNAATTEVGTSLFALALWILQKKSSSLIPYALKKRIEFESIKKEYLVLASTATSE